MKRQTITSLTTHLFAGASLVALLFLAVQAVPRALGQREINKNRSPVPLVSGSGRVQAVAIPAPNAPLVVLYDQTDNAATVATSSQNFEPSFDQFDDFTADDFVVPSGQTWNVDTVVVNGQYFNGTGPAVSFNVFFYTDSATLPGTTVTSYMGLAYTEASGVFTIALPSAAVLSPGTYWVSVQANMDFNVGGQWGWTDRTVQSNSGAAFENPGGGFMCSGGNGWVRKTTCVNTTAPDQIFRLLGTIAATCSTSWQLVANMPLDVYGAAGASDGRYSYHAGGYSFSTNTTVNSLYRYDPVANTWMTLAAAPGAGFTMASAVYHPLTNRIYVFGGEDAVSGVNVNTTRIYNIASNTWTTGANMPDVRSFMASGYNPANNKIYLVSGYNTGSVTSVQPDTWEYNPVANAFTTKAPIPHPVGGAASGVIGGHLYVAGGRDASVVVNLVWDYNIAANTWTARAPMPVAQTNVPGSAVALNRLWAFGGGDPFSAEPGSDMASFPRSRIQGNAPETTDTAVVYNPATDSWSSAPTMNTLRSFTSGTAIGSKLVAAGGYNGSITVASTEVLDVCLCADPTILGAQNFDGVTPPALPAGWTALNAAGPAPLWVTSNAGTPAPPADSSPNAAFVDDPAVISDKRLTSPSINIATNTAQLTFRNNYSLEPGFDGGVLEISINGSAFVDILAAGGSFVSGAYTPGAISISFSSPIAGRQAWTGSSGGFITTTVNLPPAAAGQTVQLRWRMASDSSVSSQGWRIDNVSISECIAAGCTVGSWIVKAPYPVVIESPSVASNGTYLYAAGGFNGGATSAANRYDPGANTWTPIASLPTALYATRAVYAANTNAVYIFGGYNGSTVLNTTHKYDIATNTWSTAAPLPAGRYFPNVAYYSGNGKIYVIGGFNPSFVEDMQTWEYDPVANTWNTTRANIPAAMAGSGTSISGQFIYLAGNWSGGSGSTLHNRYDILNNSWMAEAPVPVAIYEPAATSLNGHNYLVGGGNPFSAGTFRSNLPGISSLTAPTTSYNSTYIYDIASNTWSNGPNTNVAHSFTAGALIANTIYVVAGYNGSMDTSTVEALTTTCAPTVSNAVSRKTHGAAGNFDVPLPLTGTTGVECRSGGTTNDFTMVVTFASNVSVNGSPQAQVTSGTGTIGSGGVSNGGMVTVSGNVVTIPLTNVADQQTINVTLNGVGSTFLSDTPTDTLAIPMSRLLGDSSGNRSVNAGDVAQVKSRIGQAVTTANFRSDMNSSGGINAGDVSIAKSNTGHGVP